ncbi:hypothetical protein HZA33_04280 [Candidatus Pacearchaeota archaeon]|nr:hypothetical protein [Candidatus Pacearchaeota archaeon]
MELVALLGTGKGTWGQVSGLIKQGEWDKIFLVGDEFIKKFDPGKEAEFITLKLNQPVLVLRDLLISKLKDKLKGPEVALTIASGEGREHMALISALLNVPVGIRFVALTKDGIIQF